jgi:hypothetical protein
MILRVIKHNVKRNLRSIITYNAHHGTNMYQMRMYVVNPNTKSNNDNKLLQPRKIKWNNNYQKENMIVFKIFGGVLICLIILWSFKLQGPLHLLSRVLQIVFRLLQKTCIFLLKYMKLISKHAFNLLILILSKLKHLLLIQWIGLVAAVEKYKDNKFRKSREESPVKSVKEVDESDFKQDDEN